MNKLTLRIKVILFVGLIFTSLALRLIWIGEIPNGLNWDETAYAYNAYSLLKTGQDEWGSSHPMYLKSFNDYKPAFLSYLYIPFFIINGISNITVRLVPALLGSISILCFYGFMRRIQSNYYLSYVMAFLMAIIPWHIHFSRAALDPIVSFAFLTIGLYLITYRNKLLQVISALSFAICMYTYSSGKFFVPVILILYSVIFYRKNYLKYLQDRIFFIVPIIILSLLIFMQTIFGSVGTRVRMLLITNEPYIAVDTNQIFDSCQNNHLPFCQIISNRRWVLLREISKNYLSHFQTDFLFYDNNLPVLAFPKYGNLLLINLPFLLIGLMILGKSSGSKKLNAFFLLWLLLAPIPASLTNEVPHAGRVLIGLPAFIYFISMGIISTIHLLKKHISIKVAVTFIVALYVINFSFYFKDYYLIYKQSSERYWQGYYREVVPYAWSQKERYNAIYFTNEYDNPYIFFAWYARINPKLLQTDIVRSSLENIYFLPQEKINEIVKKPETTKNLIISKDLLQDQKLITSFQSLDYFDPIVTWFYVYETVPLSK